MAFIDKGEIVGMRVRRWMAAGLLCAMVAGTAGAGVAVSADSGGAPPVPWLTAQPRHGDLDSVTAPEPTQPNDIEPPCDHEPDGQG